jgi:hypothetical protein
MFWSARLLTKFDLAVCAAGAILILDSWRPLTWTNAEATVVYAQPVCSYSVYSKNSRSRRSYAFTHPVQTGQCADEEIAKKLLKMGYNTVSRSWNVEAVVDGIEAPVMFRVHNADWLASPGQWEIFLEDKSTLPPGKALFVRRSRVTDGVYHVEKPQPVGAVWLAIYRLILGLFLLLGTIAIHGIPFRDQTHKIR